MTVAYYAQRLRQSQGLWSREQRPGQTRPLGVARQPKPLTTRRATRVVRKPPMKRTDADTHLLAQLNAQHRALVMVFTLAQDVAAIGRKRQSDRFDSGLERATASTVMPLWRFAMGLRLDYEALKVVSRCDCVRPIIRAESLFYWSLR